jgi:hypothetical protein
VAGRPGRRRLTTLRRPGRLVAAAVVFLLLILIFGRSAAVFYTDVLWYRALDHSDVFWTRLLAVLSVRAVTGALGAALILLNVWYVLRQLGPVHLRRRYGNLEIAEQVPRAYLVSGAVAISILAGWWLSSVQFSGTSALALLAWLRAEAWGVRDPLFGHDLSFYIFSLPAFLRLLDFLLIVLIWSVLLVGIGYALVGAVRVRGNRFEIDDRPRVHFAFLLAGMLVVLGVRFLLGRYELLLDGGGFGGTIGYTDVHARLPARLILGLLAFAAAGALVFGAVRRTWGPPVVAIGVFLLAAVGMGVMYPAIVQKVQVEPNQLAREVAYIRWNMDFTRRAYGLDGLDRRSFRYRRADADTWTALAPALDHLPLWDLQQLQTLFNEIEGRARYYHFPAVDYDRYMTQDGVVQVAIGVREFALDGLPPNSQTWQTIHLSPMATRGFGAAVTPAAQKLRGDPVYWLNDVQPVQRHPAAPLSLELREPSVFFGETMSEYAIVGHTVRSTGGAGEIGGAAAPVPHVATGVALSSFARIAAFALRFGEQNLLFARELGDTSRLLFRRSVDERVAALAPFLLWDGNALPVIADGRIVWILDGYTASSNFPLARADTLDNGVLRYLRSSVKATVDAVNGEVHMYAVGGIDPILGTYRRIFPGLIRDEVEMPDFLREHLRYPALLFQVQADILEEYHLDRPEAFFAGQDVWQLPSELTPQAVPRRLPGFMMASMPGAVEPEFLLLSAFIARERQNLTGLLIARSDPPHYGELVLLEMPRDDQIRGPSQITSIIEADPFISQQLSLWQAAGRTVQRGHLRMVPTDSSILYIQPLFLSAQDRAIPQLVRVIVTDGAAVSMAEDLPAAMAALLGETRTARAPASEPGETGEPAATPALLEWRARALELMREADARLREGDFAGFGAAWTRLRALLENQPPD